MCVHIHLTHLAASTEEIIPAGFEEVEESDSESRTEGTYKAAQPMSLHTTNISPSCNFSHHTSRITNAEMRKMRIAQLGETAMKKRVTMTMHGLHLI